ncbi:glutamate decarboxylase gad1 [Coemansia sp. RSA 518]|nr:glutamate decarboxylase gad1 [Coemansia sp. RSA 1591]KAJ1757538.1 glutamate decarboxylase gad1 [Coemansia sp. RSA 1752]KAJ2149351.1 glutamate decarboxylase gad1 [Coemansia sp. RSA 564]KAJ2225316.1 glutamate decarboxylase gad1 [Coemansia sp. RSA 518]KAJ2432935.1 glutamate decarboxylase gad1 [Coemansia sp. RSA 2522]
MTESISDLLPGLRRMGMGQRRMTVTDMTYGSGVSESSGDVHSFPKKSMPARNAYQLIHDSLKFDGDPTLNCATFLTTWMEPEAEKLIMENLGKNRVDIDEYEATERIHQRCLAHLHELWSGEQGKDATGTVTVGSSEGIMLGGLAMKWRWRQRRQAEGKDASRPNIVFGANAQVALEKTARYFDIESRLVPVSAESNFCLDTRKALEMIDENTIGLYVILGSTYTGHYENVEEMARLLDKLQEETGLDVPIHVDGASGAFIAPFAHPDLRWDFRVPRVVSISTSGHKFGLTYPGIGWVLWRAPEYLPDGLTFELSYLGGVEKTFTLNFSHPACFMIAQYYQFIRFGREGYTRVMNACLYHARLMSVALEATGAYECISDMHRPRGQYGFSEETRLAAANLFANSLSIPRSGADPAANQPFNYGLPEVAFRFTDWFIEKHPKANQDVISTLMRVRGWIIPNYPLPPDTNHLRVMRVVIKEASSEDFVNRLVRDLMWATQTMLDMQSQTLGEALSTPLAKNTSTSDLANSIARSGSITMSDDMKHSHWQGILDKIGELKDSKAQQPKMELLDNGSKKSVYEKSC